MRPTDLKLNQYYDGEEELSKAHKETDAGLWVMLHKENAVAMDATA